MKVNEFSLMIGGEAGEGITRAGFLFAKACMRGGLHVFGTNDYQSLIRGGHNFYVARISAEEVYSQADFVDLLIAFNAETIQLHRTELASGGGIVYDKDDSAVNDEFIGRKDLKLFPIPLRKTVIEQFREQPLLKNAIVLGATIAIVGYDLGLFEKVLKDTFKAEVAESNIKASRIGYDYAKNNFADDFEYRLKKKDSVDKQRIFVEGNEAIGLGALRAGCKFYAGYPMTPTTGLLHFMAANERKYDIIVIPPEGEIAAANMIAGAAFAGVRAMTATSGGGFCLMSEALGMMGMTELPVVIVMGQRPGPSTGLPTYSAQGDLRFVIHAGQGEFPRVVIAPGDIEECFYETMRAFNWAEKYQMPVILLTDKYLVESQRSVEPFDINRVKIERGAIITGQYTEQEEYKRHKITETEVSPRAFPLTKGAIVRTSADEKDEYGYTTEDPELTTKNADKRMRKLVCLTKELEERGIETVKFYGPEDAQATIISWGSTKGPLLEAMKLLSRENIAVNYLQIIYLHPFPARKVAKILGTAKKTIAIEHNVTSQLSSLIRDNNLRDVDHKILKYDGRPFNPGALTQKIKEVL
ncbi:MAG: 2-oxoacid:acceptor oxidoreductase subunit alpha [Candidatus Bathyarchaeia archaeon]|jgi:2-oxoglutarate ferredoxin oxidoreductase subunit alpha|nr:2-oxoacid:acceptor oxidoreductase subunit alpha [Candidatus Bathyarchaeota archaeon A05DMB-4]MDH7595638.1 2-oxoacid:acceptor oxidoreductase subunit alpha [Candidatus Bathyarchaeota archaeon]